MCKASDLATKINQFSWSCLDIKSKVPKLGVCDTKRRSYKAKVIIHDNKEYIIFGFEFNQQKVSEFMVCGIDKLNHGFWLWSYSLKPLSYTTKSFILWQLFFIIWYLSYVSVLSYHYLKYSTISPWVSLIAFP